MATLPPTRARLSALDAMVAAVEVTQRRLFPFRLERWLPLGFVAFLDHCGREGGGGLQFPSGYSPPSPGGTGGASGTAGPDLDAAKAWLSEHLVLIVAITSAVLVFVVALLALILWINSRGVFMYVDNVASGRFDVKRPWSEHAEKAWSYFRWSFGSALAGFFAVLALLAPVVFWVIALVSHGVSFGPIAGIGCVVLVLILFSIAFAIFKVLLRDFAAPLQMHLGIPCGAALGLSWSLAKDHSGTFVIYVLLKIGFTIIAAIIRFVTGCLTCCLGFLPVVSHTLLQPLFYFERAWSLCLLQQAGYDLFPAPAAVPPPAAPPDPSALPGLA